MLGTCNYISATQPLIKLLSLALSNWEPSYATGERTFGGLTSPRSLSNRTSHGPISTPFICHKFVRFRRNLQNFGDSCRTYIDLCKITNHPRHSLLRQLTSSSIELSSLGDFTFIPQKLVFSCSSVPRPPRNAPKPYKTPPLNVLLKPPPKPNISKSAFLCITCALYIPATRPRTANCPHSRSRPSCAYS